MGNIIAIFKRELNVYFTTPIAYIFIIVFLVLSGITTFYFGDFLARGQADLMPFFYFHPWLYLIFIPAISMRVWSEERHLGTIELLFSLPITPFQAVLGKFLAAWVVAIFSLVLTFPFWLTVNYLGNPDNGVILAGYIASSLMAGSFLALGVFISSLTKNQVIAFILSVICCLFLILTGYPVVLDLLSTIMPKAVISSVASFSFLTNFQVLTKGLVEIKALIFFVSLILLGLYLNTFVLEHNKAN